MHAAGPWLRLMRPANAPSAAADVLAGALLAGACWDDWPAVLTLAGASVCLYTGGMVLNDVCDASRDATQRPERPIPAGRITRRWAACLAVFLLAVGVALAVTAGRTSGMVSLALLGCIIAYDWLLKPTLLAPVVMGLCRALNLALGMSVMGITAEPAHLYAVAVIWLYIAGLTLFASCEAVGGASIRLWIGGGGVIAAILALFGLPLVFNLGTPWYYALVSILLGRMLTAIWSALGSPQPAEVQRTVCSMIVWLIVLDACLVMAWRGAPAAGLVLLLVVPAAVGGRYFRMT